MTYITEDDIRKWIIRRHPIWFHGKPKVSLSGSTGSFGLLVIDFYDCKISRYIYVSDKNEILGITETAIENLYAEAQL